MGHALAGRYRLGGGTDKVLDLTNERFEARVEGRWFSASVDRKALKALMKRPDARSLRHFGLWVGLLVVSGLAGFLAWGTPWCVPAFAA